MSISLKAKHSGLKIESIRTSVKDKLRGSVAMGYGSSTHSRTGKTENCWGL